MPVAASSRCPRCRTLQSRPGLCPACKRSGVDGYAKTIYNSRAWKLLRDQVLSEEPLCRVCRAAVPFEVDHITPIAVAPARALDRSNLQALCPPCHSEKTRRER